MTGGRPVWFRSGIAQRKHVTPATWQGWAIAGGVLAAVIGSLVFAANAAASHPVAAVAALALGIPIPIAAYMVALYRYSDHRTSGD